MKKVALVLVLMLAATAVFAQLDVGEFAVGKWYDSKYDAIWEFSSGNIRILYGDGSEAFNFSQATVRGFTGTSSGANPAIKFSCDIANYGKGKTYLIATAIPSTDLKVTIEGPGIETETLTLKKQ